MHLKEQHDITSKLGFPAEENESNPTGGSYTPEVGVKLRQGRPRLSEIWDHGTKDGDVWRCNACSCTPPTLRPVLPTSAG
jgi:hypothetical protein